jgi:hypothetical protein
VSGSTLLALAVAAAHPVLPLPGAVRILDVPPVAPGESGELSVTILDTPMAGTPIELSLAASAVTLADNRLGWPDVVDPKAVQPRLRARFTAPRDPGHYEVHGQLRYLTCTAKRCVPRMVAVHWELEVKKPADDGAGQRP